MPQDIITRYIPPSEHDVLEGFFIHSDTDEDRKLLNWFNPPPVRLHPRNLQEFLIWWNPSNPIANFKTKRQLAEEYFNVSIPRFEYGDAKEIYFNAYLNDCVVPYGWGEIYPIQSSYLSWKDNSFGNKRPDLVYRDRLTRKIVISEIKMFYNTLNFGHAEHLLSAIDQLLLTELLLKDNDFPEIFNLELVIIANPGVLPHLRGAVTKMDHINKGRHLNISLKILNVFIPWEEIPHVVVLNSY